MTLDSDFEAFAATAWPRLVRAAVLLGETPGSAEELAQTTLVNCYRRWRRTTRLATSPQGYAYRALVNNVKAARSHRFEETPVDEFAEVPVGDRSSEVVMSTVIRDSLLRLPYDQRAVLVCIYHLDLSEAEAARVLDVPQGTIKSRKSRALEKLAEDPMLSDLGKTRR